MNLHTNNSKWFELDTDNYLDVLEDIEKFTNNHDYIIADSECEFNISQYTSLSEIQELLETLESLDDYEHNQFLAAYKEHCENLEYALDDYDNWLCLGSSGKGYLCESDLDSMIFDEWCELNSELIGNLNPNYLDEEYIVREQKVFMSIQSVNGEYYCKYN